MAEFVGGAALGAAFGELFAMVREAVKTTANFKPELKLLHQTLLTVNGFMEQESQLGRDPEKSTLALFTEGKDLVIKCSSVGTMDLRRMYRYSNKLKQYNDTLLRFFQIDLQAEMAIVGRETLLMVRRLSSSRNGRMTRRRSIPGPPRHVVGFAKPLEELKKKLLTDIADDDAWPSVVVLSGHGGQGKTTLAKMICNDKQITELFGVNIFYVTFTAKPDLDGIVGRLVRDMGDLEPYKFLTEEDALHELEKSIRGIEADHLLLVLDDVWSESERLLEKFEFPVKGLKILVTSRSRFPKYERKAYNLSLLNEEDSMKLFRKIAFPNGEDCDLPEELVSKILKVCRGYPLALEVVASYLRRHSVQMWSDLLSNYNSNKDLHDCLQRSVDALDEYSDYIKDCYQDLALFPEDERIPVASLSDMWAVLYNIDLGKTLINLRELSLRNLINLKSVRKDNDMSKIDVSSGQHYVTQHDMLRELAIRKNNRDPIQERVRLNVDVSRDNHSDLQIDRPLSARIMSFSTDEAFSSSGQNEQQPNPEKSNPWALWFVTTIFLTMFQSFISFWKPKHPKIEALLLHIRSRNYAFPQFLKTMAQLKVLIVTNYGFHPTELQNFELPCRLPSLQRIRLVHVSISSFDTSVIDMNNLKKISLSMCMIGKAFENYPLQKLVINLPNLTEIEIDCCYDLTELPSELCDLSPVTKLRITNCHELTKLPDELGKMRNVQELKLYSCTKLSKLPESIVDLRELRFLDMSECIAIEELPQRFGELQNLRKLTMTGCTGLKSLPESIEDLHKSLEVVCDEEVKYLWMNFDSKQKVTVLQRENSINLFYDEGNN